MWAALRAPDAPPAPPPPARGVHPTFHPPSLVSDSPFNDYADGYLHLPPSAGTGPAGLVFGAGAGRFTQSRDNGASWVALPQFNGDADDPDGYNPAAPFFGVSP